MTIDALDADQDPAPAGVPWQQQLRDRSLLTVIITATLTGMLTVVALQLRVLAIRTDTSAPDFATGDWLVADLGSNLPSAALVALLVLVAGIIAAADGRRWGTGLIAGSSSALAGWALLAMGLAERPVQDVRIAATLAPPDEYTATITRTTGWAVLLVLVIVAIGAAALALRHGRRAATVATTATTQPTHGWRTAALGTLFIIATAVGPLVPVGDGSPLDNVSPSPGLPGALLITRAAQLALLVVAGVVGFRWRRLGSLTGLTVVAAALSIPAWLTATSLFARGGSPVGLAAVNPGALPPATQVTPATPVTLTVVGVVGALAMIVTTGAVVVDSRRRRSARSEA